MGKTPWLTQSLYGGFFYDDKRYRLANPKPFEQLHALKTVDGYTILPPPHDDIVPAGTRVRVERIRWPTPGNMCSAPLYTPKRLIWVVVRMALDRGHVTLWREKPYIMLVPDHVRTQTAFMAWFNALFTQANPNPWLDGLPESLRRGIATKQPVVGMDERALRSALGKPDRVETNQAKSAQVRIYNRWRVILRQARVTEVSVIKQPDSPHEPKQQGERKRQTRNQAKPAVSKATDAEKSKRQGKRPNVPANAQASPKGAKQTVKPDPASGRQGGKGPQKPAAQAPGAGAKKAATP